MYHRVPYLQPHCLNTMIFLAGKYQSLCQCWRSLRSRSKGRGAIRMPWAMPLWHCLVQILQLAAKEHDDDNNDKATLAKRRQQ
jgi:hypothetical protein